MSVDQNHAEPSITTNGISHQQDTPLISDNPHASPVASPSPSATAASSSAASTSSTSTSSSVSSSSSSSSSSVRSVASLTPLNKNNKGGIINKTTTTQQQQSSSTTTEQTSSPISSSPTPSASPPPTLSLVNAADNNDAPVSHPLHRTWTFSYSIPRDNALHRGWDENAITPLADISTIEQFWSTLHQLNKPTNFPAKTDFHFFRHRVAPTWEEEQNSRGGRWLIEYKARAEDDLCHSAWLNTMLAMIGEQFTDDEIMGVVLNLRKGKNKLQIWTRTSSDGQILQRVGKEWKEFIGHRGKIGFLSHAACKNPPKSGDGPQWEV